ncbi:MAG: DNA topoisomerase IV subunit A [Mycoplasma sp.]|nr:DNA topoisomerase IV subunit A [Candidatus Hennigella equi]
MANENNKNIPIENIMSESFGAYAKYIIQDRALPDVRDGLKPVQRRIIYAMNDLNLLHTLPHKKSARTVGEVIGKYHPHGDSSIYEAMVRLSQEWKNNICLLDMHGNKGSIDGDGPAAMRYTECRLSAFGELMAEGIKKNTVPFIPNFDGSEQEPTVLPTLFPNLLINGSNGIAAGYATNIPPFNPTEVVDAIIAKIDYPNCRIDRITNIMPAPDFPTGGVISNLDGITQAYKTGKGKILIAGEMVKLSNKQIAITSIPFETNKSDIIKQIDLAKEKTEALGITEVRDESDANGVYIVLETKTKTNFDFIKNYLYKNTKLQTSFNFNMIAIKDRKPVLLDIFTFLQSFIDHAENIILKTSEFDLDKSKTRREIVQGLIKAILIIDDVVASIRKAKDKTEAVNNLTTRFGFSQAQAEAIVNLRLYRLTNTDVEALKKELDELNMSIATLENLVRSKDARLLFLKTKLREFKKLYPQPRKSKLSYDETPVVIDELDLIQDKNRIFAFTAGGYMKAFSNRILLANDPKDNFTKGNDIIITEYVGNLRDRSLLFLENGECAVVANSKIPECKFKEVGTHTNNLISAAADFKVVAAMNADYKQAVNKQQIVVVTKSGLIKRCELSEIITKRTSTISYAKLDPEDKVVSVFPIDNEQQRVVICSRRGYINCYAIDQIPFVSKNAKGVKAMGLKENDAIASAFLLTEGVTQIAVVTNSQIKRIDLAQIPAGNRTNIGKAVNSYIANNNSFSVLKVIPLTANSTIVKVDITGAKEYLTVGSINYLAYDQRVNAVGTEIADANIWISNIKDSDKANE